MWYHRIIFGEGAVLNENAKATLEELVELAKQVKKIVLVGHSWAGSYDADIRALAHEIALARAVAVREVFVKVGVSPDKIEIASDIGNMLHATEIYLYRYFDASRRDKLTLPKSEVPEYVWNYYFNAIKRDDFGGYCRPYRLYWCGQPTYQIKMKRSFLGRIINLWRERAYIKEKDGAHRNGQSRE